MAEKEKLMGRCFLCQQDFAKSSISRHLNSCWKKKQRELEEKKSKKKKTLSFFHLRVEDKFTRVFWLNLLVPTRAKLTKLDEFFRKIWVECCGHMSAFRILDEYFNSHSEWGGELEGRSMNIALEKILSLKDRFDYTYDFGSSTELKITLNSQWDGIGPNKIEVLARNHPPKVLCGVCEKKDARIVCTECGYETDGWLCIPCAKEHSCEDEMFLPVVNSPRVGVCGYEGEAEERDWMEEE